MYQKLRAVALALGCLTFTQGLFAQSNEYNALEQTLSLSVDAATPRELLSIIEQKTGVAFSYAPKVVEGRDKVTISIEHRSVRYVLANVFGQSLTYRQRGKYIILSDNRENLRQPFGDRQQIVEGYIADSKTGQTISNATIYDKQLMISATTNQYGYFKVAVPYGQTISSLKVTKVGYVDTTITTKDASDHLLALELPQENAPEKASRWHIGLPNIRFPKWLVDDVLRVNSQNISDTMYRWGQVSLLPNIGTNRKLSGSVVNGVSLNILAGYSKGVRIMEVGTFSNIVSGNARYFMAGGTNFVGDTLTGAQLAYIFNRTRNVTGLQSSGILNINEENMVGAQLSGVVSINNGIVNGAQISGIYARSNTIQGAQIASAYAKANFIYGTQIAGFASSADFVTGSQIAAIVCSAREVDGTQVSGMVNYAKHAKKWQLGLINIADSSDGISVGLLSFVHNGIHQLELSSDEMFHGGLSYRTGSRSFYNIISVGGRLSAGELQLWSAGYGFGTMARLSKKWSFDANLISQMLFSGGKLLEDDNYYRIYLGLERKVSSHFSLAFGLTTNLLTYRDEQLKSGSLLSSAIPYTLWNHRTSDDRTFCGWLGARVAVRFQ